MTDEIKKVEKPDTTRGFDYPKPELPTPQPATPQSEPEKK